MPDSDLTLKHHTNAETDETSIATRKASRKLRMSMLVLLSLVITPAKEYDRALVILLVRGVFGKVFLS